MTKDRIACSRIVFVADRFVFSNPLDVVTFVPECVGNA
jgi:hypothetical protein